MTETVKTAAPRILEIIKTSSAILLHCHPSPDPDSVGSALAMRFALQQMGKNVTVIRGDSAIPEAFMHFPGATEIADKNFFEVDLSQFDLFIVQDSSIDRVSKIKEVVIPPSLKTVLIDHHISNIGLAGLNNLIDSTYPATACILFDLFKEWKIEITPDIAANLFIGSYTDTGGFKYQSTTSDTYFMAAELTKMYPQFSDLIFKMDNALRPEALVFQGLALSNIEKILNGHGALSSVSYDDIQKYKLTPDDMSSGHIANQLKSVVGWDIGISILEEEPDNFHTSFRTRDSNKYDLSVIAASLGGGGHKAAAGVVLKNVSLDEAKKKIVSAVEKYLKEKESASVINN